jgi:hypothetical protein
MLLAVCKDGVFALMISLWKKEGFFYVRKKVITGRKCPIILWGAGGSELQSVPAL